MNLLSGAGRALLDVVFPERCTICGAVCGEVPWTQSGVRVESLRSWDRPHLCLACLQDVAGSCVVAGTLTGQGTGSLIVAAGTWSNAGLVDLVGAWKYHGVRGLAWPLAATAGRAVKKLNTEIGEIDGLVPIPLHGNRKRTRGFNQAEVLADLIGNKAGIPVWPDLVARNRSTMQQAKIDDSASRFDNMNDAFAVRGLIMGESCRIGLVDDLVTSGATMGAVAKKLSEAGYTVIWGISIGLAKQHVEVIG